MWTEIIGDIKVGDGKRVRTEKRLGTKKGWGQTKVGTNKLD